MNKHCSLWSWFFLLHWSLRSEIKKTTRHVILDPWTVCTCTVWSVTKPVRPVLRNIAQFPDSSHVVLTYILLVPFINHWIIFPCSCTHQTQQVFILCGLFSQPCLESWHTISTKYLVFSIGWESLVVISCLKGE